MAPSHILISLLTRRVVLGCGIGAGALLMLAQRSVRRYQKRLEGDRQPPECPDGSSRGPLPEGRRPLRLISSVRCYLRTHSKRALSTSGSLRSRKGRGQANGAGGAIGSAAAVPATPRSPRGAAAAAGWDLESQASLGQSSLDSMPHSIAASRGLSPAPPTQQAQQAVQQASPRTLGSLGRPSVLRPTVLQAVDSIYESGHAAIQWKSKPRQGSARPGSPDLG